MTTAVTRQLTFDLPATRGAGARGFLRLARRTRWRWRRSTTGGLARAQAAAGRAGGRRARPIWPMSGPPIRGARIVSARQRSPRATCRTWPAPTQSWWRMRTGCRRQRRPRQRCSTCTTCWRPRRALLLTARAPPRDWGLRLPDLAQPHAGRARWPGSTLPMTRCLSAVLVKLFADRQITVAPAPDPLSGQPDGPLLRRRARPGGARWMPRALAEGRPVTRALAGEVLDRPPHGRKMSSQSCHEITAA